MLHVSSEAISMLEELRRTRGVPVSRVMRVSGEVTPEEGVTELRIDFCEGPKGDDAVVGNQGTQIFVADDVARPLAEARIDVAEGEPPPYLVLRRSAPEGGRSHPPLLEQLGVAPAPAHV